MLGISLLIGLLVGGVLYGGEFIPSFHTLLKVFIVVIVTASMYVLSTWVEKAKEYNNTIYGQQKEIEYLTNLLTEKELNEKR